MQSFEIKISNLAEGVNTFRWVADDEFLLSFEGTELLGGSVEVEAGVEDLGDSIRVSAVLNGSVSVVCDRCLAPVSIPIETEFEEDVPARGPVASLSQIVYDYICTALPLQRIHDDGECDPDTVRYLNK